MLPEVDARRIAGEVGASYLVRGIVGGFHEEEMPRFEEYARRYMRASARRAPTGRVRRILRPVPVLTSRTRNRAPRARRLVRTKASSGGGDPPPGDDEPPDLDLAALRGFAAASRRQYVHEARRMAARRAA